MKTLQFPGADGLQARLLGGSDGNGGGDGPLVVLFHGFGAPGDDLVSIGQALADVPELRGAKGSELRFLFPHGLHALGAEYGAGRAWWPIDMMKLQLAMMRGDVRNLAGEVPAGLGRANKAANDLLDTVQKELGVPGERLVIGGFSQGSMIACDVAWRSERKLAGLIVLSGTVLAEVEWLPLLPKRKGLPVFQSHGTVDPVLPYSQAEELHARMTEAGLAVRWAPFRGGHGIPEETLIGMATFLRDVLG